MTEEIWTLKTPTEIGKQPNGSFSAFALSCSPGGEAGQSNWVQLGSLEQNFVRNGLNQGRGWKWLANTQGTVYLLKIVLGVVVAVRWPRVAIGSGNTGPRNQVKVIGYANAGGVKWARIAGIPKSADYSAYDPIRTPWAVHRIYCDYSWDHLGDTPVGILYEALFDPASGFKTSSTQNGLWMRANWLYQRVDLVSPPPPAPQPGTVPANPYSIGQYSEKLPAHVLTIDATRANFFVTPSPSGTALMPPMKSSDFLNKYKVLFACNGDQFTYSGSQVSVFGYAASQGKVYNKNWNEDTLYISQQNKFSFVRPMTPYNAISFNHRLVRDGAVITGLDDLILAPRTAIGFSVDGTKFFVVVVDGNELAGTGMSLAGIAKFMRDLGAYQAINLDGGGSSTMAIAGYGVVNVPSDDNLPGHERPVANHLGIF